MAGAKVAELRPVNPATLEPLGTVAVSPPEEVAEAVSEAQVAAYGWRQVSFAERRQLLGRVATELLDVADEIAATVTAEVGKPLLESYTAELFVSLDNRLRPDALEARSVRALAGEVRRPRSRARARAVVAPVRRGHA